MSEEMLRKMRERDAELARERKKLEDAGFVTVSERVKSLIPSMDEMIEAARRHSELEGQIRAEELDRKERNEREDRERKRVFEEEQRPLRARLSDYRSRQALKCVPGPIRAVIEGDEWDGGHGIAVRTARMWAEGSRRGLVLRGGVGVGKSVAAACALAQFAQGDDHPAVRPLSWHRPNDFASGMLHAYDEKAPKIGTRMVVIDDIGRETKVDFEEALVVLIDDHMTRFVITTNLTMDEVSKRYGERLIDRLYHECEIVSLSGSSKRRREP